MDTEEQIDFERALDDERRRGCRRGFLFGVLATISGFVGLVVLALVGLGVLAEYGVIPDSSVVPGTEVTDETRDFLLAEGLLEPGEELLFFYSAGLLDVRELGNLVTDRRVVSYWQQGSEIAWYEAAYPEIVAIEPTFSTDLFTETFIRIDLEGGGSLQLAVSAEAELDREYVRALEEAWERAR